MQCPPERVPGWEGRGHLNRLTAAARSYVCYRLVLEQDNCVTISGIWSHGHGYGQRGRTLVGLASCQLPARRQPIRALNPSVDPSIQSLD